MYDDLGFPFDPRVVEARKEKVDSEYDVQEEIGKGKFGRVHKAVHKTTGESIRPRESDGQTQCAIEPQCTTASTTNGSAESREPPNSYIIYMPLHPAATIGLRD